MGTFGPQKTVTHVRGSNNEIEGSGLAGGKLLDRRWTVSRSLTGYAQRGLARPLYPSSPV